MHSPDTEQPIVCSSGQEVQAVAVGRPRGGKAQGRHGRGVACELLWKGDEDKTAINWAENILCLELGADILISTDPSSQRMCTTPQNNRLWSKKTPNEQHWSGTHPVDLLGVQVPHLDDEAS